MASLVVVSEAPDAYHQQEVGNQQVPCCTRVPHWDHAGIMVGSFALMINTPFGNLPGQFVYLHPPGFWLVD